MGVADGLQHLSYQTRLGLATNASRAAIEPRLVYDAPCTVVEPSPPQQHYALAVALSTFAGRRWMARLTVQHWLHRFPRLIVSDWDDDDASGLVGMRWGTGFTWRGLAPMLCLADALCGRFDWVLFCDDDTVVDVPALSALLSTSLSRADPAQPHFLSFAPQPFPSRRDWRPTMHGCLGNATQPNCRRPECREPPDLTRACVGDAVPLSSSANNLNAMWPYGGLGFLLSRGAAAALQEGGLDSGGGGDATDFAYAADGEHFRTERPAAPRRSCRWAAPALAAAPAGAAPARVGTAHGSMRGQSNPRTFACLRELTCPWGQYRACETLPPPFNHTPPPRGAGGRAAARGTHAAPSSAAAVRRGFCSARHTRALSADCRSCGGPDVQFSCCLASLGVFVADLSSLDRRIRPSGNGNAYWSPWAASLKAHRKDEATLEAALLRAQRCGLAAGPGWDRQRACKLGAATAATALPPPPPPPPPPLTHAAAGGGGECGNLTAWSSDGFGHQLSAALSCEIYSLQQPRHRYVRSRHIELEHSPLEAEALLDFVNSDAGMAAEGPVAVKPARYHGACNGDVGKRPACKAGKLVVCDNCYGMVELPELPEIRAEIVRRLRARLARAVGGGDERCARRFDVCAHVRGVGDPGGVSGQLGRKTWVTPKWAERDSVRRRRLPAAWWQRAVSMAAANRTDVSLLVHTNAIELARSSFALPSPPSESGGRVGGGAWDPEAVVYRGGNTSVLSMLHELAFCCDALVVMLSALSSVAVLATRATRVFASVDVNQHFRLRYTRVPMCRDAQGREAQDHKHPACAL